MLWSVIWSILSVTVWTPEKKSINFHPFLTDTGLCGWPLLVHISHLPRDCWCGTGQDFEMEKKTFRPHLEIPLGFYHDQVLSPLVCSENQTRHDLQRGGFTEKPQSSDCACLHLDAAHLSHCTYFTLLEVWRTAATLMQSRRCNRFGEIRRSPSSIIQDT